MPEPRTVPRAGVVGVVGRGRLGGAVARRCAEEDLKVRELNPRRPEAWAGGGPLPDVVVDCGAPAAVGRVLDLCARLRVPLVECVSGLAPDHLVRMAELARDTAVVRATNLSLGNYLQTRALDHLAGLLTAMERAGVTGAVPEAAVLERHPAAKAHRPSATAAALAGRWRDRTGREPSDVASLRAGPPVSDHEIRLAWAAQTLTVRHEVHSLGAAAAGAVAVARWCVGRAPGEYPVHTVFDDLWNTTDRPAPRSGPNGGQRA
ncbi:dihydrodipicolinate reductase C-terminal domain-containing protein [Streptomyces sp. NPDC001922]|uniref:dihydrodipicolinate reductase C-terminal domain-containing protein n=1 Tax=Streptomyces sp. NPDC001922 TaxID=3364624 RepID=UPI0036A0794E